MQSSEGIKKSMKKNSECRKHYTFQVWGFLEKMQCATRTDIKYKKRLSVSLNLPDYK